MYNEFSYVFIIQGEFMTKYIVGHDRINDCFKIVALDEKCNHCNRNISKKKRYLDLAIQDEKFANEICRILNEEYEKNIANKVVKSLSNYS